MIRGADVGSDHHLLPGKLHLKLRKPSKKTTEQLFDSQTLQSTEVKEHFTVELQKKFDILNNIPVDDFNEQYVKICEAFTETSRDTLGHRKKQRKALISDTTWDLTEERRLKKQQMLASITAEDKVS